MPVPVPRTAKVQAHPVIKPYHRVRGLSLPTSNPNVTLPLGPHPSLGSREEWAAAFPSWRRSQQRPPADSDPIMQDFRQGLTAADNASVNKGSGAQASFPPLSDPSQIAPESNYLRATRLKYGAPIDPAFSVQDQVQFDNNMRWDVDFLVGPEAVNPIPEEAMILTDPSALNNRAFQAGAFAPIYEDQSPGSASGPENDSSPLEPVTPFGAFVDRAVENAAPHYVSFSSHYAEQGGLSDCYHAKQVIDACQAPPVFPTLAEPPKERDINLDTVTASPTLAYKTLSEPLAEWVATYVWKVCSTGFSLPLPYARPSINAPSYPTVVPDYLAPSIHSLLLATLLQPSAVLLAVWYIVRLPVYFGAAPLSAELVKERAFRSALMGDGCTGFDNDTPEASAAFRIVVLGCMLANKWLDDHTFSNKTWHSISNIPIQVLNRLEALALDIFTYDLSISSQQWSQWLSRTMSYHVSLSSPAYPQPISRPSSNPHSIMRRVIDEIIKVPSTFKAGSSMPQPVFIGLEERLRERLEKENALDALEIDLDEDGPLREEYLPKRRVGKLASQSAQSCQGTGLNESQLFGLGNRNMPEVPAIKALPPPAKWSPAGDEPILRDRNRVSGQYVAVQAPVHPMQQYPAGYHPLDVVFNNNQNWNPAGAYMPVKAQSVYMHDAASVFRVNQTAYNPFGQIPTLVIPHSRSHSLSYDQETSRNHMRSYSQSRFEYHNSDLRMMPNEHNASSKWMDQSAGFIAHSAYIHIPSVGMQPTW